jgi:hypothetical protein
MATMQKNARSLDSLETEIRFLRKKAKRLEGKIDENFTYFQHHSGSLFVRSLLPRKIEGEELSGNPILDRLLQNERLQKILLRAADLVAEKLGDGINWLVNRVFRK